MWCLCCSFVLPLRLFVVPVLPVRLSVRLPGTISPRNLFPAWRYTTRALQNARRRSTARGPMPPCRHTVPYDISVAKMMKLGSRFCFYYFVVKCRHLSLFLSVSLASSASPCPSLISSPRQPYPLRRPQSYLVANIYTHWMKRAHHRPCQCLRRVCERARVCRGAFVYVRERLCVCGFASSTPVSRLEHAWRLAT